MSEQHMVNAVNLILCLAIFLLAVGSYRKKKNRIVFLIGIAFGIFSISHILALWGLGGAAINLMVVIRVIAYVIIAYALWKEMF